MIETTDERLDRIAALLALAHREAIKTAGEEIRSDPLSAAILDACPAKWTSATEIWAIVGKRSKASKRTFSRRLAELVAEGCLYRQGAGPAVTYRSTGLV